YSPASHIDAGEYTVTLKIVDGEKVWSDSTDENDLTRTCKMTIKKKPLEVALSLEGGLPKAEAADPTQIYSRDTGQKAPAFGFTYTSTDGKGYNSDTLPTAIGKYRATAKITNECNYTLDTTKTYTIDFSIDKTPVTKPEITGLASREYTGSELTFNLSNMSDKVKLTLPDGMTYSDGVLKAVKAGTYNIGVSLADNGETTVWASGGDASYTVTVTIQSKPININISAPSSWAISDSINVTVTEDSLSSDTVALKIYYKNSGGSTFNISDITISGKSYTFTMPELAQGSYQLCVELDGDKSDNGNYSLTSAKTHDFTVTGNEISFTAADIKWLCNNNPVADPTSTLELIYTGSVFRFTIDDSNLAAKGVKIDITKGTRGYDGDTSATNVKTDTYSVTVYITSYDASFDEFNGSYTLVYRINKAKYDLSAVVWQPATLTYNGSSQSVELSGIPAGLKPVYSGNSATNVSASGYSARVVFTNDNTNYYNPIESDADSYDGDFEWTHSWNISPQVIELAWVDSPWSDSNGTEGIIPMLSEVHAAKVTYRYYTADNTPIELGDIIIDMSQPTTYFVDAVLLPSFEGNYVLSADNNHRPFTLGTRRDAVNVSADNTEWTFDGTSKGLQLVISGASLTQDDFNISYVDELGNAVNGAPVDAGNYKAIITLKGELAEIYYIAQGSNIDITINKAEIDLSGVRWNYDAANPFQYQRKDGEALPYTVELIGLPEYLQSIVVYGGTYSGSSVDSYNATFDFVGLNTDNFVSFELPEEVASKTLSWDIIPRELSKPIYEGDELIFNNEDMDILQLLGMPADWEEYLSVTVKYNGNDKDSAVARDAGTYTVICTLKTELGENVVWDDGDAFPMATASLTVSPRIVTVSGWSSGRMPTPQLGEGDKDFINQEYTNSEGESVTMNEILSSFNATFRISVVSKYGDNVIVRAEEGVFDWAEFSTMQDPSLLTHIDKPTLVKDKLQYTGDTLTFELSGYDDTIMSINGRLSVTELGEYTITVRLKDGQPYCWNDDTRDPVVLTFSVVEHLDNDPNNPGGNDPDGDN
ncbi:MAG: hypothetical protein K2I79_02430, partial [Clostridia bacterium]|nr:hypothetical protein [Clostridia bacterium]